MLIISAEITKMFVRIANSEDPDQTAYKKQSDLGLCCLPGPLISFLATLTATFVVC